MQRSLVAVGTMDACERTILSWAQSFKDGAHFSPFFAFNISLIRNTYMYTLTAGLTESLAWRFDHQVFVIHSQDPVTTRSPQISQIREQ